LCSRGSRCVNIDQIYLDCYSVFHQFRQAEFAYRGLILS
jgi:hypothetical protein